jgi:hypothetical protein
MPGSASPYPSLWPSSAFDRLLREPELALRGASVVPPDSAGGAATQHWTEGHPAAAIQNIARISSAVARQSDDLSAMQPSANCCVGAGCLTDRGTMKHGFDRAVVRRRPRGPEPSRTTNPGGNAETEYGDCSDGGSYGVPTKCQEIRPPSGVARVIDGFPAVHAALRVRGCGSCMAACGWCIYQARPRRSYCAL